MPAKDLQPEQLIQQARSGGAAELDRLLRLYRNYLGLLAQTQFDGQLRVRIDPSDLVQETMMEAFRDFGAFGGSSEPELAAWLRRILVRNAADQAKRHQAQKRDVRREVSLEQAFDRSSLNVQQALAGNFASPSAAAEHREQAVVVADALARLPDAQREVLVARHLQQKKFDEIAQQMGRSSSGVRTLWARALERLRNELKETP
ncbi:MAG: sigma-70 family RNA polymerase sigma factor [Planctomycetes bacterium]|nr:sigma-70 family RNA polymerase sigma factor [Planctomycetota bacterium]